MPKRSLAAHIRRVIGDAAPLVLASSVADAELFVQVGAPLLGVIADVCDAAGHSIVPLIESVRDVYRAAPMIIYTDPAPSNIQLAVLASQHGVEHVVLNRFDDEPLRFRRLLASVGILPQHISPPQIDKAIIRAGTAINSELISMLALEPNALYSLTSRVFEELVAELFAQQGFAVHTTASTRDGGKDLIVECHTVLGHQAYYVECKRYAPANPVGVGVVRELYGVVQLDRMTGGIIATTSYFTRDALSLQSKAPYQLALRDKNSIVSWLSEAAQGRRRSAV